ncbi:MAG TPA: hypothetical protein PLR34_03930, partial [Bacteroidales bacterium]|nr:hypothetical protein [Bacteroidales bacterium]
FSLSRGFNPFLKTVAVTTRPGSFFFKPRLPNPCGGSDLAVNAYSCTKRRPVTFKADLQGGAPKAFGAYICCSAAPIIFCGNYTGGGK